MLILLHHLDFAYEKSLMFSNKYIYDSLRKLSRHATLKYDLIYILFQDFREKQCKRMNIN